MDWPVYSPDLNLIEHVWDTFGRRIAARKPPPTCLPELRRAFLDEWCNIPQDQIDNLILSMPRRSPLNCVTLPGLELLGALVAARLASNMKKHRTVTAGSDVVQSGRPIFDDFFQHLWPYISNNTANVVFQMVKRLWLIRIDQ
ncbi:RNase H domain-containing protein [Trichonephila clavipes]|nr:RNase H domain-containing protein [Trichonephila clavipes]